MSPLFAAGINDTRGIVGKFAASVVDTSGKFATVVVDTGGAPWLANISRNFEKTWNDPNAIIRGLGKMIHEKNQQQKISWHCPFKEFLCFLHLYLLLWTTYCSYISAKLLKLSTSFIRASWLSRLLIFLFCKKDDIFPPKIFRQPDIHYSPWKHHGSIAHGATFWRGVIEFVEKIETKAGDSS